MIRTKSPQPKNQDILNALPIKEMQWVHEFMIDYDPIQAAVRAGLVSDTAPHNHKQSIIKTTLGKVRNHLNEVIQDRIERSKITEDKLILQLRNIAFFDINDLYDNDGNILPVSQMSKEARQSISEISFTRYKDDTIGPSKVKLHDRLSALQTLMKYTSGQPEQVNNYNQYNQYNQINSVQQNNVKLDDFSDKEMQVLRKMVGDQDPQEILELQEIEQGHV